MGDFDATLLFEYPMRQPYAQNDRTRIYWVHILGDTIVNIASTKGVIGEMGEPEQQTDPLVGDPALRKLIDDIGKDFPDHGINDVKIAVAYEETGAPMIALHPWGLHGHEGLPTILVKNWRQDTGPEKVHGETSIAYPPPLLQQIMDREISGKLTGRFRSPRKRIVRKSRRKSGRKSRRKSGRKSRRKSGRKSRRKSGRKSRRKSGRKSRRKSGRKSRR